MVPASIHKLKYVFVSAPFAGSAATQGGADGGVSNPAEKKLKSVRKEFVRRVSGPVLNVLLDKVLDLGVITDEEMEVVGGAANRAEKARDLIDIVRKKGSESSSVLISALSEADPCLSAHLKLN